MRNPLVLTILVIFFAIRGSADQASCDAIFQLFKPDAASVIPVNLSALDIENTITSLAKMRLQLDLWRVEGGHKAVMDTIDNEYNQKEQDLFAQLESRRLMTRDELKDRIRSRIQAEQIHQAKEKVRRDEKRIELQYTDIDGSRIIFHPIAPGAFKIFDNGRSVEIETEITEPFAMAATLTTQFVWRKIVSAAQARFSGEFRALVPSPSKKVGDLNPVEQVSYDQIQVWLAAANKLIEFGDPVIQEIMPGITKGFRLRLPTEAEWEFVTRSRGEVTGRYHFGENQTEFGDHAWFSENSDNETHPVAEKLPLIIDGDRFYDLHGNVSEWVSDWYADELQGGKDPKGPATGFLRVILGNSFRDGRTGVGNRGGDVSFRQSPTIGFRLAVSKI